MTSASPRDRSQERHFLNYIGFQIAAVQATLRAALFARATQMPDEWNQLVARKYERLKGGVAMARLLCAIDDATAESHHEKLDKLQKSWIDNLLIQGTKQPAEASAQPDDLLGWSSEQRALAILRKQVSASLNRL